MVSGRRPGFKHSVETREKIGQAILGNRHSDQVRKKIAASATAAKSLKHRENISLARTPTSEQLCQYRFRELLRAYPQCRDFLESRKGELLCALQDVKSEKELNYIATHIENVSIGHHRDLQYIYSSSSLYAHEDVMIEFLDTLNYLRKLH